MALPTCPSPDASANASAVVVDFRVVIVRLPVDEDSTSGLFFTRGLVRSLGRRGSVVMRNRVTRFNSSAIIAAVLFAAFVPTLRSADRDTSHLDGRWTLNRALSQIPRDVG